MVSRRAVRRGTHGTVPAVSGGGNARRRSAEIVDAAARVFAERGYHGATTQDIADVLGIRQASLYYYFSSKEAALELVCSHGVEAFVATGQAIAKGPGTAGERLAGLIRAHIAPLLDRNDYVKVFLTQRQFLPTASRRRVGQWSRDLEAIFQDVVRDGIAKREFRADADPRLVTLAILGMANWVSHWYGGEKVSVERIGNEFVVLILSGLAASGNGGKRTRRDSMAS
jgi:AcrR family transcriptional regulator